MRKFLTITMTVIIAAAIVGAVTVHNRHATSQETEASAGRMWYEPTPPPEALIGDKDVSFAYTDDNVGENIIIRTDSEHYVGQDGTADVYISLTNDTDTSQSSAVLFYFPKNKKADDMKTLQQVKGNQSAFLTFFKGDVSINEAALGSALTKRNRIPDTFEVRSGTQVDIPAHSTIYLAARLQYTPGTGGEFWVEALGDHGAYGLLDPKYGTTASTDTYAAWYSSSYTYRRKITINHALVSGGSNLSSFPVLVYISDDTFKLTSSGGNVASGSGEFVFTSSDGTTKLSDEVEAYTGTTGKLFAWVKVPTLSASQDTILYVYYGGPASGATNQDRTGVWNGTYTGVWHLDETPSATTVDSSGNFTCTTTGMSSGDQVAGQINGSLTFNGGSKYVDCNDVLDFVRTADYTFSAWIKPSSYHSGAFAFNYIVGKINTSFLGWAFDVTGDTSTTGHLNLGYAGNGNVTFADSATTLGVGSWIHVVGSFNHNISISFYVNGSVTSNADGTFPANANEAIAESFNIGNTADNNPPSGTFGFTGLIDEVHVAPSTLTAGWIGTEYNNQINPMGFSALGGQQAQTLSAPPLKIRGGVKFR